jgi:hypothetical protein
MAYTCEPQISSEPVFGYSARPPLGQGGSTPARDDDSGQIRRTMLQNRCDFESISRKCRQAKQSEAIDPARCPGLHNEYSVWLGYSADFTGADYRIKLQAGI